jgi:hypothetical protein
MHKAALAWLAVVSLSACGGGTGGGPIPLDSLDEAVVEAACRNAARCGQAASEAACVAAIPDTLASLRAAVKAGKVRYDSAAAGDCIASFNASGCDLFDREDTDRCAVTFLGTQADGAACFDDEECLSKTCETGSCAVDVQCCAGLCGPTTARVPKGGDCGGAGAECVEGTFCMPSSTTPTVLTCQPPAAEGQPCNQFGSCATGLVCDGSTAATRVCKRLPKRGQPCTPNDLPCSSSLDFCDPDTNVCAPRLPVGAACDPAAGACIGYALCDPASRACVARKGLGEACAAGECAYFLSCSSETKTCAASAPQPACY